MLGGVEPEMLGGFDSEMLYLQLPRRLRSPRQIRSGLGSGIVAVEAVTCQPFTVELKLQDPRCSTERKLQVRAAREQVPITIAKASTLYTLQGSTTTPGMIYHFRTPRRLNHEQKELVFCYFGRRQRREPTQPRKQPRLSKIHKKL